MKKQKKNLHILHSRAHFCELYVRFYRPFAFYTLSALVADDRSHLFAKEILLRALFIANFRGNFQHHAIFMILIFFRSSRLQLARGSLLHKQFLSLHPPPSSPTCTVRWCRSSSPFICRIIMLFLLLPPLIIIFLQKREKIVLLCDTSTDCVIPNLSKCALQDEDSI